MAQSRLERIGTIYSRVSSLIKGGAMKPEDRPLWFDLYTAFPPKVEPRYDRVAPNIPVRDIFYKEDPIRAKFHREHGRLTMNLQSHGTQSQTQKFLHVYNELAKSGIPESEVYEKAVEKWTQENIEAKSARSSQQSETTTDKPRDSVEKPTIVISDIFKELDNK
ncbi:small ribosomal subunit protein mS23 [Diachasmimorpha longicaudata]|uniref:small ribosomal subunit protein mS23 n=1 Tax=Diachasmimorpha longicaudata TaxID=58733 RepID=UPI0030B8E2E5